MQSSDSTLWKFLKFFQLKKVYRLIKGMLPISVVNAVNRLTLKNVYIPLVFEKELEPKYEEAWKYLQSLGIDLGDYLEFGVSPGTSMACMHRVLEKFDISNIRLFGFDSFQGMPKNAVVQDRGSRTPEEFASTVSETEKFLAAARIDWNRTYLIEGWFDDTLNAMTTEKFQINKASVIMVDCDNYSAAKSALNYSMPMIIDYAVIFFDDWNGDKAFGESKAYSEFLSEHKHLHSVKFGGYFPYGKIFVVKNTQISPRIWKKPTGISDAKWKTPKN